MLNSAVREEISPPGRGVEAEKAFERLLAGVNQEVALKRALSAKFLVTDVASHLSRGCVAVVDTNLQQERR